MSGTLVVVEMLDMVVGLEERVVTPPVSGPDWPVWASMK